MISSSSILKIGLIGPGDIADKRLIPALAQVDGAVFWSVLSRDRERAQTFSAKHNALSPSPAYTDLADFLIDPALDAVLIATPDRLHASQAVAAAQAGKHVFVEKPMASSVEEAQAVRDACKTNQVRLAVGYHLRWHAGHRLLREKIDQGELGALHHIRVQWTFRGDPSDWRASADVGRWWALGAVGTHALDLVRWFMSPACGPIIDLRALRTQSHFGGPHEETALVALRFASGATAEIMASVLFSAPRSIEIYGGSASAVCRDTLGPHGAGVITLDGKELPFRIDNPYVGELTDFVRAVQDGRPAEVDGEGGLANVELLEQASRP